MSAASPMNYVGHQFDEPFWKGCIAHQFLLHRCTICERDYWPASTCIDHGSQSMEWAESSGAGVVHTYTVVHHAYTPEWADKIPYAMAVVRLAEGPFFHTNIVGCDPADVHVGMKVTVIWDDVDADVTIPRFTPTTSDSSSTNKDTRD
jgi:uncharacterized OB-fold protein